ncbi:DUF4479 domain-containing protein [Listeria welshimeri]|uniref:YtpR family tRNA-binding protein n=1 Tax=Listeria welshimeri TaxID=1643 RepID=UPI00188968B5|nr:DUF4479 family protein [Listeria welshimeri]MBF2529583.1 DUF4479 domain-containing protein [Listeria welshimeri]
MIVNAFYNEKGVGDTLLIETGEVTFLNREWERRSDVARIFDRETKEVAGYNIFNSSKYFDITANGKVELTEELVDLMNQVIEKAGFEPEIVADLSPKFVVGYVESKEKHPNADKLNVCQINVGEEVLQIVCGAPNIEVGQKVVVAKIGAVMPSGLIIKPSNLRGEDSFGMVCAARELAIPNAPTEKGILVLENTATPGEEFSVNF